MRHELDSLRTRIAAREKSIQLHQSELEKLRAELSRYYDDGGLLPMSMMSESEQAAIRGMKFDHLDCEYCGEGRVKLGRGMKYCMACGHVVRIEKAPSSERSK